MPVKQANKLAQQVNQLAQRERVDRLTALLCKACLIMNESAHKQGKTLEHIDIELAEWYIGHRKAEIENIYELLNFASDAADELTKEDFDRLNEFLTDLRCRYT